MNSKIGYICFIGEPNAGKSTIFNAITNYNISRVTHKVHTTRDNIKGIISKHNTQLVFIDTPGYLKYPKYKLEQSIVKKSLKEINQVDFICIVIDITKRKILNNHLINLSYFYDKKNIIIIINKIDLINCKNKLFSLIKNIKYKGFDNIYIISAIQNKGIKNLLSHFINNSPRGNWFYNKNQITDKSVKIIAENITSEQLYKFFNKEMPYNLQTKTELWKEKQNDLTIYQTIIILKYSQKKIILGINGNNIKNINILSKNKIKQLVGKRIHFYLFIRVKLKWIDELS